MYFLPMLSIEAHKGTFVIHSFPEARWCVLNEEELLKCHRLVAAIDERSRVAPVEEGESRRPWQTRSYADLPQVWTLCVPQICVYEYMCVCMYQGLELWS